MSTKEQNQKMASYSNEVTLTPTPDNGDFSGGSVGIYALTMLDFVGLLLTI
ncbi:hypothetical protein [Vibrio hyugaensis]|uniref:hypothetical protein n=1 Tax=Vibrio hyugaensis TaxID=1534743 RepID=UPI003DA072FC